MNSLLTDVWSYYESFLQRGYVAEGSIPVLYFGNLPEYLSSPVRIVTVALNPSDEEFPNGQLTKFPAASPCITQHHCRLVQPCYQDSLNEYFEDKQRAHTWFGRTFEPLLSGMQASYFSGAQNRALHTDLCTMLATTPKWGNLSRDIRGALMENGVDLWHRLIDHLSPHIVIMSFAWEHVNTITYTKGADWRTLYEVQKRKLRRAKSTVVTVGQKQVVFVWGETVNLALGAFNNDEKKEIGKMLLAGANAVQL